MAVIDSLLEGFDAARHPRGFHGRWIGTSGGKVLRVFHGDAHLGDAKPGASRDDLLRNVAGVVSSSGRGMRPAELTQLVNRAQGSPSPSPRVVPRAGANAPRGGIPSRAPGVHDLHIGDKVRWQHPRFGSVTGTVKEMRPDHALVEPHFDPGVGGHFKVDYSAVRSVTAGPRVRLGAADHVRSRQRAPRVKESAPEVLGALLERDG